MGATTRTVSVRLAAEVASYVQAIGHDAVKATRDLSTEVTQLGKTHKDQFKTLTDSAGALGLGLAGAFGLIVKSALGFDKEMSTVQSVSDASGKQLDQLRVAAINAGQATVFSATQAAQAEEELAKAGVSTSNILNGGLNGALSLAAAGNIDLASAATDAAQAMNIWGLSGASVGHIADVLAAGANTSAADVKTLADAMKQGGQIAASTGLSLEDTVAVLSAFADHALVGFDAGTSLKTMLQALAGPSKQSAAEMRDLGISAYDATGKFIGISNLAQELHDKLGGLTQAQRDQALAQIFGTDAARAALVLMNQGAAGVDRYRAAVDQVGAAQDAARTRMDNLSGDIENLRGSFETLTITAGEGANGGLRKLTQGLNSIVQSVQTIPGPVQTAGTVILGVGGAGLVMASGLAKAKQKSDEIQKALRDMGPIGGKAADGLGKVTSAVGKVTVALAALQTASALLGSNVDPKIEDTVTALDKFAKTGDKTGVALSHLDYDLGALGSGGWAKFGNGVAGTIEGLTGLGSVFDESLTHAKERINAIDTALAAMVSSGHADDAAAAFDKLAAEAKKQGISLADLTAGLPQYEGVLGGATSTQQANTTATSKQTSQYDLLHESLSQAIDDAGSLKDAFDKINGAATTTAGAQIAMTDAVDSLTQSMKTNKASFDANTVAGAANLKAFIDGAGAARDYAQAVYDQTGSLDQANAAYSTSIQKLDDAAIKAGATKKQVQDLNAAYAAMPPLVSTTVQAPGLADATNRLLSYKQALNDLNGKVVTTYVTQDTTTGAVTKHVNSRGFNRWGGLYEHAAVGTLRDAALYSPTDPGRYVIAEPQTGGEAFVPKYGDVGRSRSILDVAESWVGRVAMPVSAAAGAGVGMSGGSPVTYNVYPQRSNLSVQDMQALTAAHEARMRVGRRG